MYSDTLHMLMICSGSRTGKLLPTGNPADKIDGIWATMIDAGNPCIFIHARHMFIDGTILPDKMNLELSQLGTLDHIRRKASVAMGLSKDEASASGSVPKIAMVTPSESHMLLSGELIEEDTIDLVVRAISVGNPHKAVPVTVALALAAAANIQGSVVHSVASRTRVNSDGLTIGHPSGKIVVSAEFDESGSLAQVTVFSTARRLMDGFVYWK